MRIRPGSEFVLSRNNDTSITGSTQIIRPDNGVNKGTFDGVTVMNVQYEPVTTLASLPQLEAMTKSASKEDTQILNRILKMNAIMATLEGGNTPAAGGSAKPAIALDTKPAEKSATPDRNFTAVTPVTNQSAESLAADKAAQTKTNRASSSDSKAFAYAAQHDKGDTKHAADVDDEVSLAVRHHEDQARASSPQNAAKDPSPSQAKALQDYAKEQVDDLALGGGKQALLLQSVHALPVTLDNQAVFVQLQNVSLLANDKELTPVVDIMSYIGKYLERKKTLTSDIVQSSRALSTALVQSSEAMQQTNQEIQLNQEKSATLQALNRLTQQISQDNQLTQQQKSQAVEKQKEAPEKQADTKDAREASLILAVKRPSGADRSFDLAASKLTIAAQRLSRHLNRLTDERSMNAELSSGKLATARAKFIKAKDELTRVMNEHSQLHEQLSQRKMEQLQAVIDSMNGLIQSAANTASQIDEAGPQKMPATLITVLGQSTGQIEKADQQAAAQGFEMQNKNMMQVANVLLAQDAQNFDVLQQFTTGTAKSINQIMSELTTDSQSLFTEIDTFVQTMSSGMLMQ
jgi:hypothetical protein